MEFNLKRKKIISIVLSKKTPGVPDLGFCFGLFFLKHFSLFLCYSYSLFG